MASKRPRGVEGIFGSAARAKTLGYLAQASTPKTGYAIAKDLELGVSNVYPELKRLEEWAIVTSRLDANGAKRFALSDEDLRAFLLKRVRILSSVDWFSAERMAERQARFEEAKRLALRAPRARSMRGKRPFKDEFRRPPEKDRALKHVRGAPREAP